MAPFIEDLKRFADYGSSYIKWVVPGEIIYIDYNHDRVFSVIYKLGYKLLMRVFILNLKKFTLESQFNGYYLFLNEARKNSRVTHQKLKNDGLKAGNAFEINHQKRKLDDVEVGYQHSYDIVAPHFLILLMQVSKEKKCVMLEEEGEDNRYVIRITDFSRLVQRFKELHSNTLNSKDSIIQSLYKFGFEQIEENKFTNVIYNCDFFHELPINNKFEPDFVTRRNLLNYINADKMQRKLIQQNLDFDKVLELLVNELKNKFIFKLDNAIKFSTNLEDVNDFWESCKIPYSMEKFIFEFVKYGYYIEHSNDFIIFKHILTDYNIDPTDVPKFNHMETGLDYRSQMLQILNSRGISNVQIPKQQTNLIIPNDARITLMVSDRSQCLKLDAHNGLLTLDSDKQKILQLAYRYDFKSYSHFENVLLASGFIQDQKKPVARYYHPLIESGSEVRDLPYCSTRTESHRMVIKLLESMDGTNKLIKKYRRLLKSRWK